MEKAKIDLEEVAALTKTLFHEHYAGNLDAWFSYLCKDSVYLGTGEPRRFLSTRIPSCMCRASARRRISYALTG